MSNIDTLDAAKVKRLRSAIQELLSGASTTKHSFVPAAEEMSRIYNLLRAEVQEMLPDELAEEFDRLFAEMQVVHFGMYDLHEQLLATAAVRSRLELLNGWLKGAADTS